MLLYMQGSGIRLEFCFLLGFQANNSKIEVITYEAEYMWVATSTIFVRNVFEHCILFRPFKLPVKTGCCPQQCSRKALFGDSAILGLCSFLPERRLQVVFIWNT